MSRIRVALFNDRAAAEPVRAHLRQAGIPAEIHNEPGLVNLWFVSTLHAGVRVEVPARLFEAAGELLRAWDAAEGALRDAIRCPECGSLRVDYPQFTDKSLFSNLAIGLVAGLSLLEKDYYCECCHNMWPKPGARSQHVPAPLAPDLPGRFHRLKLWRKTPAKAVSLCGVMLVLGRDAGLGQSAELGSPAIALAARTDERREVNRPAQAGEKSSAESETPTYLRDVLPILMGKCSRCHGAQNSVMRTWLDYRAAYGDRTELKRRVWNSWKGSYFRQPMPAGNSPEARAMTEEERLIIKHWVENGAPRGVLPTYSDIQSKPDRIKRGQQLFGTICAACHQPAGQGIPNRFPPLAASDFLNADKHRAIKIVVNGLQGEVVVNGQKFNNSMPMLPLSDQDVACTLTYVYNSFGNSGKEVAPEEVTAVRAEKEDPIAAGQNQSPKVVEAKNPYD